MKRTVPLTLLALLAAGCGGGSNPARVVSDPGAPTLQQVQASVFDQDCARSGCHVGFTAPFDLDLSAGQALGNTVGVPSEEQPQYLRIDPFNPQDSYLFMKISGDPRITGDPMPAEAPPLSSQKIQLIESWIAQGANP